MNSNQTTNLQALTERRDRIITQLRKIANEIPIIKETQLIRAKIDRSVTLVQQYDDVENEIISANISVAKSKRITIDEEREMVNEMADNITAFGYSLNETLGSNYKNDVSAVAPTSVSPIHSSYLKPIELPLFSENNFEHFWAVFISLIDDNPTLAPVIKYHYLVNYLSDSGKSIIAEFLPISAQNYELAKDALIKQYNNPRRGASKHVMELLNYPNLNNNPSGNDLASLVRTFKNSMSALEKMNIKNPLDFLYFQILYNKLDKHTRMAFDNSTHDIKAVCSINELTKFIQSKVQVAELDKIASTANPKKFIVTTPTHKSNTAKAVLLTDTSSKIINCVLCKEEHQLYQCNDFKRLNLENKFSVVKNNKVCFNCLCKHGFAKCNKLHFRCINCNAKGHHSSLCKKRYNTNERVPTESESKQVNQHTAEPVSMTDVMTCMNNKGVSALLATALLLVKTKNCKPILLRAIIDNASQQNFICESAVQQLGCQRSNDSTLIRGIGGTVKAKGRVDIEIISSSNEFKTKTQALVLNKICANLPVQDFESTFQIDGLADMTYNKSGPIQLLLGADIYAQIISSDRPIVKVGGLVLIYTELGYIVNGTIDSSLSEDSSTLLSVDESLHAAVHRLWETEEFPKERPLTPDEKAAEEFYIATTKQDPITGKYIVRLPFKSDSIPLVENKCSPIRYYYNVERRINQNPEVARLYNGVFSDYVNDGMLYEATSKSKYLLLHHAVSKESSSTTKVRPVFNASTPDKNGNSLNSQLLTGAPLQTDINDVLLRFRTGGKYPILADCRRMYNTLILHPDCRKYQHLLWRSSPNEELKEYECACVMFGISSSAYLAQRTVEQTVHDYGSAYLLGSAFIRLQRYVDDFIGSFRDLATALQAKTELIDLMGKGGFQLHKFASSYSELLDDVSPERLENVNFDDANSSMKVLGLGWTPKLDCFHYSVQPYDSPVTKREVLKWTAKLFDPTGYLTPLTVWMKMFLKELWKTNHGWDDDVRPDLKEKWVNFVAEFPLLRNLKIDRYIPIHECDRVELVGFSDGSSLGFGVCLYLRCVFNDKAELFLIRAKAKVTPIKPLLTIPRSELQGANMLAELYHSVRDVLNEIPIAAVYFCVDSTILMYWILQTPIDRLQLFCANRISNIRSKTEGVNWRHLPSAFNSSDPSSRSLTVSELLKCDLWWKGPDFMRNEPITWPTTPVEEIEIPELKIERTALVAVDPLNGIETIIIRFSSLNRLISAVGWIKRYQYNCHAKGTNSPMRRGPLKCGEFKDALQIILRQLQHDYFANILECNNIPTSMQGLNPFINKENLLAVGGRLSQAKILPLRSRHPVLIPRESHLAVLICRDAHVTTLHGGPALMRATVQSRYWIIGITKLLKKTLIQCRTCYKLSAKAPIPKMADLPASRFADVRPFLNVATDFAGYFNVHEGTRPRARIIKVYICIFTCLSVRLTHLEVCESLSTESFMAAVSRFVARRGLCAKLYSDNGTNYRGADRQLNEIKEFLLKNGTEIEQRLALQQISCEFICPGAPWKNGVSESVVKLTKKHLYRVTNGKTLTFFEFNNLVIRIESVLNSRPLIPLSIHPQDGILTPSCFVTGDSLLAVPEADIANIKLNVLTRWQIVTASLQSFWKQWRNNYLQLLIKRSKWTKSTGPEIKPNSVVIIKSEDTPPLIWPLGIITEILPHSDGTIRIAKVRLANRHILLRPVNKLIPLPIE